MNEFKIGDRVVTTLNFFGCYKKGSTGSIIKHKSNDGVYLVKFDPDQPGVNYTDGITSPGSWYVNQDYLEPIPESQENTPWYESEEGKEWLSTQHNIEEQFVQEKQKRMPKRGDHYFHSGENVGYILAQSTSHEVCLIDLISGNRWTDPVKVIDTFAITEDEWTLICAGDEFILINP